MQLFEDVILLFAVLATSCFFLGLCVGFLLWRGYPRKLAEVMDRNQQLNAGYRDLRLENTQLARKNEQREP